MENWTSAGLLAIEQITPQDFFVHQLSQVLVHKRTRWQELLIGLSPTFGKMLVLDGEVQSCVLQDSLYHEPLVHPAMVLAEHPRRVLIVGGAEGATLREVLKWRCVSAVSMVEIDGEVLEACRDHLPEMHQGAYEDERVELLVQDIVEFVRQDKRQWDVVIIDITDPAPEGPAAVLYSQQFLTTIHRRLGKNGVLVLQAGSLGSPDQGGAKQLLRNLKVVFPTVGLYAATILCYPGPWGFALASKSPRRLDLEPEAIDTLLDAEVIGQLKVVDGVCMRGMMSLPRYIREAL